VPHGGSGIKQILHQVRDDLASRPTARESEASSTGVGCCIHILREQQSADARVASRWETGTAAELLCAVISKTGTQAAAPGEEAGVTPEPTACDRRDTTSI